MRYCVILFFVLFASFNSHAQLGWEPWEIIYSDSTVIVEVQFRLSDNSCELDGKKYKFRTRIRGEFKTYNYFVNWKMDYTDCNGNQFYQQNSVPIWKKEGGISNEIPIESIDDIFTARSLDVMHYDEEVDIYPKSGTGRKGDFKSVDPKGIIGKNKLNYGESTVLSINGGALGEGAEWIWYKDTCGTTRLGSGSTLKIQPNETTVFFVRAEGRDNITNCAQLTVRVNQNSKEPSNIILKTPPCKGVANTLKVNGGFLGLDAVWKWYEDSCNGNFIGTGSYISIKPSKKTTYFVRAEGKTNVTECTKIVVDPLEKSLDPTASILYKDKTICQGDSVELSIPDIGLAADAHWSWSKEECGDYSIGVGPKIKVMADTTTTYFVRGEGQCNMTKCASATINVNIKSVMAERVVSVPDSAKIFKRKSAVLTLNGGTLGTDADWNWYKGSCKGKFISKGDSLTIHPRKKTTYYVKASGLCNSTDCKGLVISPIKYHYFNKQYTVKLRNSYHIGGGLGLENFEYSDRMKYTKKDTSGNLLESDSVKKYVNASGIKVNLVYHPIINRYMSFGLFGGYSQGTTTLIVLGNKTSGLFTTTEVKYFYERINYGSELALGLKKVKVLGAFNRSSQSNDYTKTTTSDTYVKEFLFNEKYTQEMLSIGLRLGSYTTKHKDKRPHAFDIVYSLSRNIPDQFLKISFKDYKDLSDWKVGAGFNFWVQSRVRMRLDITSNKRQSELHLINFNNIQYMATLAFSIDRFKNYK
jgi:hypothetical protein